MTTPRTRLLPLLAAVLLLLALPPGAASAQNAITTTLTAEPAQVTVGDPVSITLSVTHPGGYFVIVPQLDPVWGDFAVAGQSPATTTDNGDGTETTTVVYDTRLFAPGDFTTPSLTYTVTDGAGNLYEFTAQPVSVTVNSVLVEGDTELRDIKPQATIPTATWPYLLGGGLALAALGGSLFWLARRRRPEPAAVDTRSDYQRALDDLAAVAQLNLPADGRFNEHYTQVSDIVRRYLGATYHIPVVERTTDEIRRDDLVTVALDPALRGRFVAFLQDSDLVKFANFTPNPADAAALLTEARGLIEAAHAAAPLPANGSSAEGADGPGAPLPAAPAPAPNGRAETQEVTRP
jgi:hypothetical protein